MTFPNNFAPLGKRFMAYLIDMIPIVIVVFIISYFFFGFNVTWSSYLNRGENIEPRAVFIKQRNWIRELCFILWVVYCAVMEATKKQGTWGKYLMGIRVVNKFGYTLTLQHSIARNFTKLFCYIIFPLLFAWVLFDKKKQCLHDKLHGTYVVDKDAEIEGDI